MEIEPVGWRSYEDLMVFPQQSIRVTEVLATVCDAEGALTALEC